MECEGCGASLEGCELGQLGNRMHYSCRACGLPSSERVTGQIRDSEVMAWLDEENRRNGNPALDLKALIHECEDKEET